MHPFLTTYIHEFMSGDLDLSHRLMHVREPENNKE